MARHTLTRCWVVPLVAVLSGGCDSSVQQTTTGPKSAPPAILQELQDTSPGPWRVAKTKVVKTGLLAPPIEIATRPSRTTDAEDEAPASQPLPSISPPALPPASVPAVAPRKSAPRAVEPVEEEPVQEEAVEEESVEESAPTEKAVPLPSISPPAVPPASVPAVAPRKSPPRAVEPVQEQPVEEEPVEAPAETVEEVPQASQPLPPISPPAVPPASVPAVSPSKSVRQPAEPVEEKAVAEPAPTEQAVPLAKKTEESVEELPPVDEVPESERSQVQLDTQRTVMPWAQVGPRTAAMAAISQRADERVRHGLRLAQRGALYSARAEFIAALQIIAQANDAEQDTQIYTKALTAGLTAIREANDFLRPGTGRKSIDMARLVAGHKTPVLKESSPERHTPLVAAQHYYVYAQEQLAASAGQELSGSMALFGMAKVAVTMSHSGSLKTEHATQAMALYEAALIAEPRNFLAANELGVLTARSGNLLKARDLLIRSATLSPQLATWKNLAVVHTQLGEREYATRASSEVAVLEQTGQGAQAYGVKWVDPETFERTAPAFDAMLPTMTAPKPAAAPAPTEPPAKPAAETERKGISAWLPWTTRR